MASLNLVVQVVITKGTRTVPLVGFGVPLIVGPSNRFVDAVRQYAEPSDMIADGFLVSDPEYLAAVSLKAQTPKPPVFLVGKNTAAVSQISNVTITTVANTTLYTITINGVLCSYTSDGSATAGEIQAGLVAAINGSSQASVVTAANGAGTSVDITSDVPGLGFSITVTANLAFTTPTPNHSIVNDIITIQAVNDSWYGLIVTSHVASDVTQIAAFIETQLKVYGTSSNAAGIIASTTTDIAFILKAANYDRTWIMYSGVADTKFPEAAWFGRMLPTTPGSANWKFKGLAGITADNLSSNAIANAQGKNANLYITIGADVAIDGVMASGEYIDVTIFIDWLQATMQANVMNVLLNNDKIPYTNKGIVGIENAVQQTLQQGEDNQGLAPGWTVSVPDANSVSQSDKANRVLNGVKFNAELAGAINKVNIDGFVSV